MNNPETYHYEMNTAHPKPARPQTISEKISFDLVVSPAAVARRHIFITYGPHKAVAEVSNLMNL